MSFSIAENHSGELLNLINASASPSGQLAMMSTIQKIFGLSFLHLKELSLMVRSIKVHLGDISAFHPYVAGRTVFSNPMTTSS